jgi:O-acetyl-ADP-ribose deacetylase (regulator of RNase III)
MEEEMLFDDDPREIRKKEFIARMRKRKAGELLNPLSEKLSGWKKGEIDPAEVFKAAGYAARRGEEMIADFKKRPDVILAGIAMDENRHITSIGEIGIEVRLGDITKVFSDAIVVPAGTDGRMNAGAAVAVRRAGGEKIEEEARSRAPIPPGTAISTGSGELTTGSVIHAAVGNESGSLSAGSVTEAMAAALNEAQSLEAETVAVPGLGYIEGGIGAEESAAAIVKAIEDFKGESVVKILLVDVSEEVVSAFVSELEKRDAR